MMNCYGCGELKKEVARLNEQLNAEHEYRKRWREQWCKDGAEMAMLREKLKHFDVTVPGAASPK